MRQPSEIALDHHQVINLMKALDYKSDDGGVCFGLAFIVLQLYLEQKTELLTSLLDKINRITIPNQGDLNERTQSIKDQAGKDYNDIRAFFDAIELYHSAKDYPHLFTATERPSKQLEGVKAVSKILGSTGEQPEFEEVSSFSGVYTEQSLVELFKTLKFSFPQKRIAINLSCSLNETDRHSLMVGYDGTQWFLFDANKGLQNFMDEESLSKAIHSSYFNQQNLILSITAYEHTNDGQVLRPFITQWAKMSVEQSVKKLKELKTDVTVSEVIHQVILKGQTELFKLLLLKLPKEVFNKTVYGLPPLCLAYQRKETEILKLGIEAGLDLNLKNMDGNSLLHYAANAGDFDVVEELVGLYSPWTVDVNACDKNNLTPLMMAAMNGHLHVVEELIKAGAHVYLHDNNGFTALHYAASQGHLDIVNTLLQANSRVNKKSHNGKTALSFASESGHIEVVNALLGAGAQVMKFDVEEAKRKCTVAQFEDDTKAKKTYSALSALLEDEFQKTPIRNVLSESLDSLFFRKPKATDEDDDNNLGMTP